MTYPVKWFTSAMAGAPRCSGTAGDMVAMLDALLINGFNLLSVQSLSVTADVATVTFASAHGYLQDQIVLIAGATPVELNGEKRVLSVPTTTTFTFDATGVTAGTAAGTIGCRTAPVGGWEKVFSGTNKAAYRSADITGTRLYLRIDDSLAQNARARGYESMTDVDTGLGPFPTDAQLSGGFWWRKSDASSTAARYYWFIGDSKMFYLYAGWTSVAAGEVYLFGDLNSHMPTDAYHCVIGGNRLENSTVQNGNSNAFSVTYNATYDIQYIARTYAQTGGSLVVRKYGLPTQTYIGNGGMTYPSPVNNGTLLYGPLPVQESATLFRGVYPGMLQPLTNHSVALPYNGTLFTASGRVYGLFRMFTSVANSAVGFDLTGWR